MTYLFTFVAGTGHVAYSVLPVIAEVATETKIPSREALGIAVIASQQAITASPISAATVALLGLLAGFDVTLFEYSENNDSCYHYRGTCGRLVLHEGGQGVGRRPGVQKEVDRRLS